MTFKHFEAFVETARLSSVTRAAENLYLTQPTVSLQIKELENQLGVELFHRLARGVELTDAGRILYKRALELLEDRDRLLDEASGIAGLLTGVLEFHASNIPGDHLLPPVLGRFIKAHPGLRVVCRIADSSEVIELVAAGRTAFGVVGRTEENPALSFDRLWDDRIGLYAAPDSGIGKKITLEELAALPLVMREKGSASRRTVDQALSGAGLASPSVAAELGSSTAVREALLAGLGAAFMSEVSVRREVGAGLLYKIEITGFKPVRRSFYLATNRERRLSPGAAAFREFLLSGA